MGFFATLRATDSNRLFWSIIQQILLKQISIFSLSFTEVLHALGVAIWIHNSCYSLGTTIQAGKHQQLEFIIFYSLIFSFKNMWIEMKNIFPHLGRKSQPFMLLIHRSLNYTQFKCLNGIGDPSWSFTTVQQTRL